MTSLKPPEQYRRRLPHLTPANTTFFVTTILAEAIPERIRERWPEFEGASMDKSRFHFRAIERYLHCQEAQVGLLADPRIARMVYDAICYRNEKVYILEAFTLMPNHIHLLFTSLNAAQEEGPQRTELTGILHSLKSYTGKAANALLGRSGPFWQHESYDHKVRSSGLNRIIHYIQQNPVRAGLVADWRDHPWTWCREEYV